MNYVLLIVTFFAGVCCTSAGASNWKSSQNSNHKLHYQLFSCFFWFLAAVCCVIVGTTLFMIRRGA